MGWRRDGAGAVAPRPRSGLDTRSHLAPHSLLSPPRPHCRPPTSRHVWQATSLGSRMLASSEFGNRVLASAHKAADSTKGVLGGGNLGGMLSGPELGHLGVGNLGGLLSSGALRNVTYRYIPLRTWAASFPQARTPRGGTGRDGEGYGARLRGGVARRRPPPPRVPFPSPARGFCSRARLAARAACRSLFDHEEAQGLRLMTS